METIDLFPSPCQHYNYRRIPNAGPNNAGVLVCVNCSAVMLWEGDHDSKWITTRELWNISNPGVFTEPVAVPDVLRWLGEDQDRVWALLALWNDGCKLLHDEGICEFIIGGLCTKELTQAATAGAEVEW